MSLQHAGFASARRRPVATEAAKPAGRMGPRVRLRALRIRGPAVISCTTPTPQVTVWRLSDSGVGFSVGALGVEGIHATLRKVLSAQTLEIVNEHRARWPEATAAGLHAGRESCPPTGVFTAEDPSRSHAKPSVSKTAHSGGDKQQFRNAFGRSCVVRFPTRRPARDAGIEECCAGSHGAVHPGVAG
jgi:hypothetical protein